MGWQRQKNNRWMLSVTKQAIDRSQVQNGRLCRVVVTDLGEYAPAITITYQRPRCPAEVFSDA